MQGLQNPARAPLKAQVYLCSDSKVSLQSSATQYAEVFYVL